MRKILAAALCLMGMLARAEVPEGAPVQAEKVPQSIWQVAPDGTATHLQSTLVCASEVGNFRRTRLTVYDSVGFDVSCNYVGRHGWITLYLTRLGAMSLDAAFDDAKRQLVQHAPEAVPLPDADQTTFPGAETYRHLIYSEKKGALWSGIWMTDFSGWMFEFRATYAPDAQAEMFGEMAELVRRATANAGAHLALCAKSAAPVRDGTPVTDRDEIMSYSLLLTALAFDPASEVDEKVNAKGEIKPAAPAHWCAEAQVAGFKPPILLWHAVTDAGAIQPFDRATVATYETPPELLSRVSDVGILFDGATGKDGKPRFAVTMTNGEEVFLYGIYSGRPNDAELARLITAVFDNRSQPLAKVNPKTKAITIYSDEKK